ncbi:MAG: 4-hydroxy-3-methylbut-2-enyl diphosphate reductase [Flavobacteriales bacterium]|nr:4-hydroxy-3-methylbut-2-enyl diphosphate reductase [Flavobacteriales bacterium]
MKQFDIPTFYRSSFISKIKEKRKITDPRKKDFSPTLIQFGEVEFLIARHFGFCYGVENAIEIAYKAVEENPGKTIYLLSQMIHNPAVNNDLRANGIRFIMDTQGNQFIPWEEIHSDDIVIIPAFGTTKETMKILEEKGIEVQRYDTTCPFVTKVWKQSDKLGKKGYTVIIHGKPRHEETRATFSHSSDSAKSIVVCDMKEAQILAKFITGELPLFEFENYFKEQMSEGFDPEIDLQKVGVVNQTTMLASDTQAIADFFKGVMLSKYGNENIAEHFADSRDTLCYATNDNQQATYGLLEESADLSIVVGGFNSSNTSHLVELCEEKLPTYFISSAEEIVSDRLIRHYDYRRKVMLSTKNYLGENRPLRIILTSGASCPDAVVDRVLDRLLAFFETNVSKEEILENLESRT